jgi:acetylornithine deacetylase/succinyl-diaminopimelate desuccinylase-like protein
MEHLLLFYEVFARGFPYIVSHSHVTKPLSADEDSRHAKLEVTTVNELGLLYRWHGSDPELKPLLFMAHYDVLTTLPAVWALG